MDWDITIFLRWVLLSGSYLDVYLVMQRSRRHEEGGNYRWPDSLLNLALLQVGELAGITVGATVMLNILIAGYTWLLLLLTEDALSSLIRISSSMLIDQLNDTLSHLSTYCNWRYYLSFLLKLETSSKIESILIAFSTIFLP